MIAIAKIHVGDWVATGCSRKGRVISVGRLTATVAIRLGDNYVQIGYLLSRLVELNAGIEVRLLEHAC
jgi:hypothetical protein